MAEQTFTSGQILTAAQMTTLQTNIGLAYISSTTIGVGQTSVPVASCFSATYDHYKIIIQNDSSNGTASHLFQFGGITTNVYYTGGSFGSWGIAGQTGVGSAVAATWTVSANVATSTQTMIEIDVFNPFNGVRKTAFVTSQASNGHVTLNQLCTSTSSATGFTLSKAGDTMTGGTITVYGYRK